VHGWIFSWKRKCTFGGSNLVHTTTDDHYLNLEQSVSRVTMAGGILCILSWHSRLGVY